MSKIINCVIDTFSKKEREQIVDYISKREPFVSLVDDYDGFELFAVSDLRAGWVGVMVARCMVEKYHFKHFHSLKEFINFHEGK